MAEPKDGSEVEAKSEYKGESKGETKDDNFKAQPRSGLSADELLARLNEPSAGCTPHCFTQSSYQTFPDSSHFTTPPNFELSNLDPSASQLLSFLNLTYPLTDGPP